MLVTAGFSDQVRAEEAARALQVWGHANPALKVSPAAVLAKGPSKTVTYHPQHIRVGGAIWRGVVIGAILFALPAAGAAAVVVFVISALILGLLGLIGVLSGSEVSMLNIVFTAGAAFLAALVVGIAGAVVGCLIGLVVGLINDSGRGFSQMRRAAIAVELVAGCAAVLVWTLPYGVMAVREELARLGGEPPEEPAPQQESAPAGPGEAAALPPDRDGPPTAQPAEAGLAGPARAHATGSIPEVLSDG